MCYYSYFLARKYINRREDRIISKDESSYIAEIGKKIEVNDVMDVENRYVTFGKTINALKNQTCDTTLLQQTKEKKPGYQAVKEGIRWALDAAGNTGQYIRYVNMKIDNHQQQINHIKDLHEKFDREIQLLQSENMGKLPMDKKKLAQLDIKTITQTLDQLLLGKRNTKTKLRTLESELAIAEKELEFQEKQIEDVREFLKKTHYENRNNIENTNEISTLKIIKEELHNLSKDNDVSRLSDAIDALAISFESKY